MNYEKHHLVQNLQAQFSETICQFWLSAAKVEAGIVTPITRTFSEMDLYKESQCRRKRRREHHKERSHGIHSRLQKVTHMVGDTVGRKKRQIQKNDESTLLKLKLLVSISRKNRRKAFTNQKSRS